uniref:HTH domain-containing protein n=1 Tax=Enterocloster clostridioformis TaxID=1531 RepID=UPI0025A66C47|nr:HTH domain-containing protein [Enterocloster clostridioformis]
MKEVMEKLLHVEVKEREIPALENLPLFLRNGYEIKCFSVADMEILFINPRDQITVTSLYKHWKRFEAFTGVPCVVYGNEYTRYGRERMIELGIPFYFGKDNLYLPFLGIVFGNKRIASLPEIEKFAPVTQKMLLIALYENWRKVSTRQISERLRISRATAARCLIELQALGLPLVNTDGKSKYYQYEGSAENLYRICREYFDSPVAKSIALAEIPEGFFCRGGLTAIAEYSMLADNAFPTFAVTKEEYRELEIERCKLQPNTEVPVCMMQVLRYKIENKGFIDPISATLCITGLEQEDPRIKSAVEEILEDILNGKGTGSI